MSSAGLPGRNGGSVFACSLQIFGFGEPSRKHGEILIKTENYGDLRSRTKRSKTQYNTGVGKEINLLIYEHNVSHCS